MGRDGVGYDVTQRGSDTFSKLESHFDSFVKAQIMACILFNYISQEYEFSFLLLGSSPLKEQSN